MLSVGANGWRGASIPSPVSSLDLVRARPPRSRSEAAELDLGRGVPDLSARGVPAPAEAATVRSLSRWPHKKTGTTSVPGLCSLSSSSS